MLCLFHVSTRVDMAEESNLPLDGFLSQVISKGKLPSEFVTFKIVTGPFRAPCICPAIYNPVSVSVIVRKSSPDPVERKQMHVQLDQQK